jgi:hypothetical protein
MPSMIAVPSASHPADGVAPLSDLIGDRTGDRGDGAPNEDSLLGEVMVDMTTYVAEAAARHERAQQRSSSIMAGCAAYEETDFVDYFARTSGVSDAHLSRIAEVPKCLAVIDAFVTTPMRLGTALFHLGDEFDRLHLTRARAERRRPGEKKKYPLTYLPLIKQVARRIELGPADPRSFKVSVETKQQFQEMYNTPRSSRLDFQVWLNNEIEFQSYDTELEDIWQSIRPRDEREYCWYWQVSHGELLQALLCNRRFVAGLEATYASRSTDPSYIHAMLDEFVGDQIPMRVRHMFYHQLASRMWWGFLRIPDGLREEFPEYYRDPEDI